MIADTHDVADALRRLEDLGEVEARAIYDPLLNRALEPVRTQPAVEVVCGRNECGRRLAYWALDGSGAYVLATQWLAKPRARHGGLSDLATPSPRQRPGIAGWIEIAESETTTVRVADRPNNNSGYPLRVSFVCPCGASPVTTNSQRLRLLLSAFKHSAGTIVLT